MTMRRPMTRSNCSHRPRRGRPAHPLRAVLGTLLALIAVPFGGGLHPSTALQGQAWAAAAAEYDLVIRNGRVLDGAGNPWIAGDVAVRHGRIVRVGRVVGAGAREIDAAGRYVSPGFVDIMDQSGPLLLVNGLADNKLRMGVTSGIGGEGGTPSIAGVPGQADERGGARSEDIPLTSSSSRSRGSRSASVPSTARPRPGAR